MFISGEGLGHIFDNFLKLRNPSTNRGLFLGLALNHFAGIFRKGGSQRVRVAAFEKYQIARRLCGGIRSREAD